jgi:hypothetical protein
MESPAHIDRNTHFGENAEHVTCPLAATEISKRFTGTLLRLLVQFVR